MERITDREGKDGTWVVILRLPRHTPTRIPTVTLILTRQSILDCMSDITAAGAGVDAGAGAKSLEHVASEIRNLQGLGSPSPFFM